MIWTKTLTPLCGVALAFATIATARAAPFDDAIAAYKHGDYEFALRIFRPLAEEGNAKAQGNLGRLYALGQGVTQDYPEAVKWFRRSADQGEAFAQFNLGLSYENGRGIIQDYMEAAKWYQKAADQKYAPAQKALGDLYFFGDGVTEDDSNAMKWYRKAADQGLSEAQFSVGSLYEHSQSITHDFREAAHWYQLAAEQGNADAEFALGEIYRDGRGVPQDNMLAYKWFRRAAENSDMSHKNHAVSELHSLARSLPIKFGTSIPSDPFGKTFRVIWPNVGYGLAAWAAALSILGLWQFKFAKRPTESVDREAFAPSVFSFRQFARRAELLFWVAFISLPLFTGGWQGYNWLKNESYYPEIHTLSVHTRYATISMGVRTKRTFGKA
jgi:TPR repeat protein